jgi:nucleoside-diphosphate-sugar epimerase
MTPRPAPPSPAAPVIVTGATGFLGRHVTRLLLQGGTPVAAPVRNPETLPRLLQHQPLLRTYRCDLLSSEELSALVQTLRPRAIVHCAAYGVDHGQQDPATAVSTNVNATLLLHQAASRFGAERFIHVGTGYEYGSSETDLSEDDALRPEGAYGASKASASLMLRAVRGASSMHTVIARPFGMFGDGEGSHKLVPQVVQACVTGVPLDLTEGYEVRDYLPVTDVARALVSLITLPLAAVSTLQEVNLCSGQAVTVRQVATTIAAQLGGVELLRFGARPSRPSNMQRVVGNPERWRQFCREQGLSAQLHPSSWEPTVLTMRDSLQGLVGAQVPVTGPSRTA